MPRTVAREGALVSPLFLGALFTATFVKVHWDVAGTVYLADVTALAFLVAWGADRVARPELRAPRTVGVLLAFLLAFLLVYLTGFFNLETRQALDQFGKGITKWLVHFTFLVAAVWYLAGRSRIYYRRALAWFLAGFAVNAAYGLLQLAAARAGTNLDSLLVEPLTGGASKINVYGAVQGAAVYRPNALTGDPNHLGIMLVVPLLILAPVYLRLPRGHGLKLPLAGVVAFLLIAELATLSRSGLLGLGVGALVLAVPYRRYLASWALALLVALVVIPVGYELYRRRDFFEVVIRSRLSGGKGTAAHLDVYSFVPDVLHSNPLFGLGYNNFSVYYEFVTGKSNWGPHSYYVALLVEGGLVGTVLFLAFLGYLFHRLAVARRIGRALALAGDPQERYARPVAWGMTAALVGTMAANAFYLTMGFFYFFVFAAFALALPIAFSPSNSLLLASDGAHATRVRR
jgi:O-antigen ligase